MSSTVTESAKSAADVALQETLDLLEWPRLCEYVATFASTSQGFSECKSLSLPMDLATSRQRLDETIEIGELDAFIDGGLNFQGIYDLADIVTRCVKGGVLTGEELLKVADTLLAARRLRRQIDNSQVRPVISALIVDLVTLPELEKILRFGLEEGGRVADQASQKLRELRLKWQAMRSERRTILQDLVRRHISIIQDTAIGDRNGRPVLALKVGTIDQIQGVVHSTSASGNTVFLEPHLIIGLGNRIAAIESDICKEEHRLLADWSADVAVHSSSIEHLGQVMLKLDLALARARFSDWLGGVPPVFVEDCDAPFSLKGLRHPLLVCQEIQNQGSVVVPVTIEVPSNLKVVAITGPNTGGKTVTLKSVGLAVLMARVGIFLPCIDTPSFPWCSHVLADIGDEQSLEQNLSTFSSHIMRIKRILTVVDKDPGPVLVLLDEVGAGTDPAEGTALAIALLRTLADKARLTIATTHFGELKALKYSDKRFENASVGFDTETLKPTYYLHWGIPGRSNALEIARRLGLAAEILDSAQKSIGLNDLPTVDHVIRALEQQRQRQQTAAEDAALLLARTELLHDELLRQWEEQCRYSKEMKDQVRREVERLTLQGKKEVSSLIRSLREKGADGETARRVGKRLRQIEIEHRPGPIHRNYGAWSPKVGDYVRLIALAKAGEVLAISGDGLQLTVLCGVFRSTVGLSDIESLDGRKPSKPETVVKVQSRNSYSRNSVVRSSHNTVDVRGLRVHEAEVVVEECLRKEVGPLWVIHGIGTGKLKRGLRNWLETVPYVEKVTDADQSDGGAGCTVVWLE